MLRKLGCLIFAIGLVLPAVAADKPGTISGYVRTANGVPQMGAMVEVLGSALHSLRVFTDEKGFYSAVGLLPGVYTIRVSAPTFLSQWKEHVGLKAGGSTTVNLTLTNLLRQIPPETRMIGSGSFVPPLIARFCVCVTMAQLSWLPMKPRDGSSREPSRSWPGLLLPDTAMPRT
jgi:hypothetical protein